MHARHAHMSTIHLSDSWERFIPRTTHLNSTLIMVLFNDFDALLDKSQRISSVLLFVPRQKYRA
jgi:hypothetical protein